MNGKNIVAATYVDANEKILQAVNPATGQLLDVGFEQANEDLVNAALAAATNAFQQYRLINKHQKASFLIAIADELNGIADELLARASAESGLPLPRLQGELGRTTGQLQMFARLVTEGSWVRAVIETAQPHRQPMPKPDLRKMLVPIGPVVVFGASNFPLAFSVAGGDTASAFAAGCPVIVKAHPAHYGTSALVGEAIMRAVEKTGMPKGVFSLLYDDEYAIGSSLVKHPLTKAVTFTGSLKGGMALVNLAQQRSVPIPVFAEMGSTNPVVFLPIALQNQAEQLAKKYAVSITAGAGQFCTKPGLLFAVESDGLQKFKQVLAQTIATVPSTTMLTSGIATNFMKLSDEVLANAAVKLVAASSEKNTELLNQSEARIAEVSAADFIQNPSLKEEVFGPFSLLIIAKDTAELMAALAVVEGQLTTTVMAEKADLEAQQTLLHALSEKTGRIILNGVPTGVEVCSAMQHGGPFPATNDSRFTSVGTDAIYRFVRPLVFQDWDADFLPMELRDGNPFSIYRTIDQQLTKA